MASRTIRLLAGIGTAVAFTSSTLPNMFPSVMEEFLGLPSNYPHPDERYQQILKDVCSQMKVDPKKVHIFYNKNLFALSGGCLHLPQQSVIGLPMSFIWKTTTDVRNAPLLLIDKKEGINWDSEFGKDLEEVLLISEKHAKFIIAHELVHIKDMDFVLDTLHITGFCLGAYKAGALVASYSKHSMAPWLVWGICYVLYKLSREVLNHWMEYKADQSAATLGLEYSDGGVEFLCCQIKMNLLLRTMNGENGEKLYSEEGDNLSGLSTHPRETERLKRIKIIRKTFDT